MRYKTFLSYLFFSAMFLSLAVAAGIEFSLLPFNGTWGSDAQYYYMAASGQGGESSCTAYLGYGYVCTFTAFLNVLDLPMGFYTLIGMLYIFTVFRYFRPRGNDASAIVWMLLAFNPIVIWTFLKGVKEGFVILFLLLLVKLYGRVIDRGGAINVAFFAIAMLILSTVKFEAVAFVVLAAGSTEVIMRTRNKIRSATLLVALSIFSLFVLDQLGKIFPELALLEKLMAHKALFFTQEIDEPDANVNYLFAVFRFIVGPGPVTPISSLFSETGFYEPTVLGKILIFLGSTFWLGMLGLAGIGMAKVLAKSQYRHRLGAAISRGVVFSALMALYYTLTYAYMYGGMVDTRHRAVVYVLLFPLLTPLASLGLKYFTVLGPRETSAINE
jgi:hypothetical protein